MLCNSMLASTYLEEVKGFPYSGQYEPMWDESSSGGNTSKQLCRGEVHYHDERQP